MTSESALEQSNASYEMWLSCPIRVRRVLYSIWYGYHKLDELPFCLTVIKELHKTLLTGVRGAHAQPGEFRTRQVHIGSTRRYVPPPAVPMMECLYKLECFERDRSYRQRALDEADLEPVWKSA